MKHQRRREAAQQFKLTCGEQGQSRLSLVNPRFNLREVAKQMVLLEDHLCHPYKHCSDCIRKHLLTIEAFAEEAVSLDQVGVYRETGSMVAELARVWLEQVTDGRPLPALGQDVRQVRKLLVPMVADPRQAATRVASRYLASSSLCVHQRPASTPAG